MRRLRLRLIYSGTALVLAATVLSLAFLWTGSGFRTWAEVRSSQAATWPAITWTNPITGLTQPVHLTHAGDGSGRLFVVEKPGRIRVIRDGDLLSTPFLSIVDRVADDAGEQGLLSVAFPPGYISKGYFYVNYTDLDGDTVVARYHVTDDPDIADPDTEEVVFTQTQPYANHNGGQLAFGPDGYLYIGMGDGGGAGDPEGAAQDPASLLGKILRIDVELDPVSSQPFTPTTAVYLPMIARSGGLAYRIPPSNPYTQTAGYRDEIWALGLRNPWRFSFDRTTGDLYMGDVGQRDWEEIDHQRAQSNGGENYGWNIMEGTHCYPDPPCDQSGLVLPVTEYDHSDGNCSVTGGFVYRGSGNPNLQRIYVYGDFCSGRIWGFVREEGVWQTSLLADSDLRITSFGEDQAGNLYVIDFESGTIYEIIEMR